jgi:hypothetical protein
MLPFPYRREDYRHVVGIRRKPRLLPNLIESSTGYRNVIGNVVISTELSTSWLRELVHRLMSIVVFFFDGSSIGPMNQRLKVVIRKRVSRKVLYSEGPYDGEVAILIAKEASRVVGVLGVQGYLDRERR